MNLNISELTGWPFQVESKSSRSRSSLCAQHPIESIEGRLGRSSGLLNLVDDNQCNATDLDRFVSFLKHAKGQLFGQVVQLCNNI
jgi:hypothetical protein